MLNDVPTKIDTPHFRALFPRSYRKETYSELVVDAHAGQFLHYIFTFNRNISSSNRLFVLFIVIYSLHVFFFFLSLSFLCE